jgi:hypothetical protein
MTLDAIEMNQRDGALIDVQLGEASIYPAANELALRGIPFILASARDSLRGLPTLLASAPSAPPFDPAPESAGIWTDPGYAAGSTLRVTGACTYKLKCQARQPEPSVRDPK